MTDLADIYQPTTTFDIVHPATREPVGVTVELFSPESPEVKAVNRRLRERALRSGRGGVNYDQIESGALDTLAAAVKSWSWADGMTWHGEVPTNDAAFIRKVLGSPEGAFIRAQIDAKLASEADFTKASTTS